MNHHAAFYSFLFHSVEANTCIMYCTTTRVKCVGDWSGALISPNPIIATETQLIPALRADDRGAMAAPAGGGHRPLPRRPIHAQTEGGGRHEVADVEGRRWSLDLDPV
jgi:hypothetical protein